MQLQPRRVVRDNISSHHFTLPMPELRPSADVGVNASAGHLSVHLASDHPIDTPFLFEKPETRIAPAAAASIAWHILMAVFAFLLIRYAPRPITSAAMLPEVMNTHIVWLSEPGPGGGGGGGGNRMKEPPRAAELPGKDQITVPVTKPPKLEVQQPKPEPPVPIQQVNIPAKMLSSAQDSLPGAIEAPSAPPTLSQGSGSGGGAGTGAGTGVGPGTGSGLGPGSGGGTGGGVYQMGSGVKSPVPICAQYPRGCPEALMPKPQYTSDAMRAKLQGTATVDCIVETDGLPSNCRIIRSLDSTFGLDEQAVKAANQWRFIPGTRLGQPVRIEITIELNFTLR